MPLSSGLSFYETSDFPSPSSSTYSSITYGFDTLSADDISVVGINVSGVRVVLIKDTDYTLNLTNKTVTATTASWSVLTKIASNESTRIRVFRTTSVLPLINFKAGAVLSEDDLDNAYKQGLFAAQEMTEDAADTSAGVQSVTEGVIEDGAVTNSKLASNAVTETRILDNAVSTSKIQDNSITAAKIITGAVGSTELAALSVTSGKIGDDQVTNAKIAAHSIGYLEIANSSAAIVKDAIETQSASSPITPDVLKYSPFSPRCYGSVSYDTSAPALATGSYNVASVSEAVEDGRTVTFSVPLTDSDYVVIATMQSAAVAANSEEVTITSKSTAAFTVDSYGGDGTGQSINFVVFGSKLSA